MADSVRQQIIDEIDARFKTILTSNGFETNLGQNIFAWRVSPFVETELPGLNYRDRVETRTLGVAIYECLLPLEVEVVAMTVDEIRACIADVERAVFYDETWNTLALATDFETNESAIEQKENLFVASQIIVNVEYRTNRGDPLWSSGGTILPAPEIIYSVSRLSSDPNTGTWDEAQGGSIWYNTTDHHYKGWNGTEIILIG